jgi:hypothetical protein
MSLFAALHGKRVGLRILTKDQVRHAQASVAGTVKRARGSSRASRLRVAR